MIAFCLVQRPEEMGLIHNKTGSVTTVVEGETEFEGTFIEALETEIILDRKFLIPGYVYNLTLISLNLHDITSPNIIMKWHIMCENPVRPQDWQLDYEKNMYYGNMYLSY